MPQLTFITRYTLLLLLLLSPSPLIAQKSKAKPAQSTAAQSKSAQDKPSAENLPTPQVTGTARIVWTGTPKITRYRLQLARDEAFTDIVFDKLVLAREYTVTELVPGGYFWRVAPAAFETGAYTKPLPVTINAQGTSSASNVPPPALLAPPENVGWRTATGSVEHPRTAHLRAGAGSDLICVNAYGMVYAVGGDNGVALWSARYRPNAKKGEATNSDGGTPPFAPLLISGSGGTEDVLVAFDGGVRALAGATGKELWRVALPGEALSGAVIKSESGAITLAVFDNSPALSFLKGDTGQVVSQTKLDGMVVGSPAVVSIKDAPVVLLALNNGKLDMRNPAGDSTQSIKLDAALTTAPLIVKSPRGQLAMIGTESGLVALNAADLEPLWRVATEGDAPQGLLSATDLDGDGADDVLMITRRGRVVAVNTANGKIRWYADGASDAGNAVFADVNGDGTQDVLVAGGKDFALGLSGRDGTLIWKAEETNARSIALDTTARPRALLAASFGGSNALLVGADPTRAGLRAVGLPPGAVK
ncbi:MAG: PQQ-binding-like beta-propeller repeat protein [Acidobacteria bacterium]|nr:PQQ-binding-like beta-propeller repeat protein [Acidobacteriota bacterium]